MTLATHRRVQQAAKQVLATLPNWLSPADTEQSIAHRCRELLEQAGITATWYYDCPALVLLGSRSCLSIFGRAYQPALEPIGTHNLVTVDLSPLANDCWGDCARSYYIEDGEVTLIPRSSEFRAGQHCLAALHQRMQEFATPQTTFEELFQFANRQIEEAGFENLDFAGNVGHSLAKSLSDRQFIEAGNRLPLSACDFFTFEPHIRQSEGRWGFKHENVYYFNAEGQVEVL